MRKYSKSVSTFILRTETRTSPAGVEPTTSAFGGQRAIQLCHGNKMSRIVTYFFLLSRGDAPKFPLSDHFWSILSQNFRDVSLSSPISRTPTPCRESREGPVFPSLKAVSTKSDSRHPHSESITADISVPVTARSTLPASATAPCTKR